MHALRHAYASVLLDAGESIRALSEYLGHSDPGFTLRTYTHLLPSSETRTRKAIDDAFMEESAREAQGTSASPAKPMCPQCALAA
ncbi:tyrosine-type recombinase/integrase [Streptomyces sp. JB150]|uniref:tyrosine-type recombinase/integrase n=1 Tax=Streptomyces sp. JB150 TaxID=2714844 RepID=UPI001F11428C|nr:tyrosine-type recombinase/integrase [Streptomyces sp. JB150]